MAAWPILFSLAAFQAQKLYKAGADLVATTFAGLGRELGLGDPRVGLAGPTTAGKTGKVQPNRAM